MFERPAHRRVAALLAALDVQVLQGSKCLFGGGTRIALELDEFRESRDLDFLIADAAGFAALRMLVRERGCAALFHADSNLALPREPRTDQYAVRFPVQVEGQSLRVEFIREARITLDPGVAVPWTGVPCLSTSDCFSEKLLANSDRWPDDSVRSRDLIDLAALRIRFGEIPDAAWTKAEAAYKEAVRRDLQKASARFVGSDKLQEACFEALGIGDQLRVDMIPVIERWAALEAGSRTPEA